MTTSVARSNRRYLMVALGVAIVAVSTAIGAYVDWIWWPVYSGLMLTIAAVAILLVGGIVALVGRGIVRTGALFAVAAGIGLLLGQNLGPSREELIGAEGTMTLTLTAPVAATATAPASCNLVGSESEYSISGDPNMRLDTPDEPFVSVYLTKGDRWLAHSGPEALHHDDIQLRIDVTAVEVPADGGPQTISMAADAGSVVEGTFSNAGGSITFAELATQTGVEYTGETMDLEGTLTWTCDTVTTP